MNLPIDDVLPSLMSALCASHAVALRAPPGAGKTTRVAPAMLDHGLAGSGQIVVLQPRRFAARAAARRIARERGVKLGGEIGYHVRFDRQAGPDSRIVVMTDGVFVRLCQDDPFLEGIAAVVFDEFHERRLTGDLALGMTRRVQQTVRPDLKMLVMSATLAAEQVSRWLDDCPVIASEGRMFPVEIRYLASLDRRPLEQLVAEAVDQALRETSGDVLVFLPGLREIRRCGQALSRLDRRDLSVMELYGDLPAEMQDAVFLPCERRKVVLATNIAETSVTIEGITAVVDSGLARTLRYDPAVGLDRLELGPISRASAEQRAGRAGRTQSGLCLRLWPRQMESRRPAQDEPEVRRVDLAGPVLALQCWDEPDVHAFPWLDPPPEAAVERALSLLERLGAVEQGTVTELGRMIGRLPAHPRIGRMLYEGWRLGQLDRVARAAALLSERDILLRGQPGEGARSTAHSSTSDVLDRVAILEEFAAGPHRNSSYEGPLLCEGLPTPHNPSPHRNFTIGTVDRGAARQVMRAAEQLGREARSVFGKRRPSVGDADEAVLRATWAGYSDRLARRRQDLSDRGLMVGGRGVRLASHSAVRDAELFACIEVDDQGTEALVRRASAVDRDWLDPQRLQTRLDCYFDEPQRRLVARRRTLWDDLVLDESPAAVPHDERTAAALAAAASDHWPAPLPADSDAVSGFVARVRWLVHAMPELNLPPLDDTQLQSLLPVLSVGRRSLDELRQAPWLDHIKGLFDYAQLQAVERLAPERLTVPSGSRIVVRYEQPDRPPILAVRIQELFGLRETPRVAGGRVPVLLHLLAPNFRPQQVTDDLASFWTNTYPQVRKDLRGRYPKHAWPENPLEADPVRGAKRTRL